MYNLIKIKGEILIKEFKTFEKAKSYLNLKEKIDKMNSKFKRNSYYIKIVR